MSGHPRFENLDCPVEAGEECVVPQRRGWGWDRSINPVYLTALLALIVSILLWAGGPGGVNSHFSTVDAALVQQAKDVENNKAQINSVKQDTRDDLRAINEKLDRLIERRR